MESSADLSFVTEPPEEGTAPPVLAADQVRLLSYWYRLAGEEAVPLWDSFDPLEVWTAVPYVVLYQILQGGQDLLVRLPGGAFEERVGVSLRGRRLRELYGEEALQPALQAVQTIVSDPRPRLRAGTMALAARRHQRYRRLSLPFLRLEGGPVEFILAHYTFDS